MSCHKEMEPAPRAKAPGQDAEWGVAEAKANKARVTKATRAKAAAKERVRVKAAERDKAADAVLVLATKAANKTADWT